MHPKNNKESVFAESVFKLLGEEGVTKSKSGGPYSSFCEKALTVGDYKMKAKWSCYLSGVTDSFLEIRQKRKIIFRAFIRYNTDRIESFRIMTNSTGVWKKRLVTIFKKQYGYREKVKEMMENLFYPAKSRKEILHNRRLLRSMLA